MHFTATHLKIKTACFFLMGFLISGFNSFSQTTYTWTGSTSSDWNTANNWSPAGVPSSADYVIIGSTSNNPSISGNVTVAQFSISLATLTLNGNTLAITNSATFSSSVITSGTIQASGSSLNLGATQFAAGITATCDDISFNGSTFNQAVILTKTGATGDGSAGGNTFNSVATFNNNGAGEWIAASSLPDIFNAAVTVISNNGLIYLAFGSTGNIFNGDIIATNNGQGIQFAAEPYSSCAYNGNITVNNTSNSNQSFVGFDQGAAILASGKTISVGSLGFSSGYLQIANFTQLGSTPQSLTVTGTAQLLILSSSTFNGNLNISGQDLVQVQNSTFNGTFTVSAGSPYFVQNIYNGTYSMTKSGPTNQTYDLYNDGNTYNGPATIINNAPDAWGGGYPLPDVFNSTATFISNGGSLTFAYGSIGNVFNGDITVINNGSNNIQFTAEANATCAFNGNIIVNNTNGGDIAFGGGQGTLANGKTITIGSLGFNSGYLEIGNLIQLDPTPLNFNLTGTASLYLETGNVFTASVTGSGSDIFIVGSTFNQTVNLTKTGTNDDYSSGGNTFNAAATINNSSTGQLLLEYGTQDIFNASATFNNNGGSINVAYESQGVIFNSNVTASNGPNGGDIRFDGPCQFNGNIIVNSTGGGHVAFGTGACTLANGKTVSIGIGGFDSGYLDFQDFTQLGNTPQSFTFTGTGQLYIETSSTFNGNVTMVGQNLLYVANSTLNGSFTATTGILEVFSTIFNGVTGLTKTGPSQDGSNFGNTFNSVTTITNNGAGQLLMGDGQPDIFNGPTTFINGGSAAIFPVWSSTGNIFNNDLTVIATMGGVQFSDVAASAICQFNGNIFVNASSSVSPSSAITIIGELANGKTISVGSLGFNGSFLNLTNFTQLGSTAQQLNLGNTSQLGINTSTFNANLNGSAGDVYITGSTFQGVTNIVKTGSSTDPYTGGNSYNAGVSYTNNGTGLLEIGLYSPEIYNSTSTIVNNGAGGINVAMATAGNIFGGDLTLTNTGSAPLTVCNQGGSNCNFNGNVIINNTGGSGIKLGNYNAFPTLANGKTISIGSLGFNGGSMGLVNLTQLGSTAQSLIFTGSTELDITLSAINGPFTASAGTLQINSNVFNEVSSFTKTGSTDDSYNYGNTYNGAMTITNNGTGYWMAGNELPDMFNASASFINNNSGDIYLAYNTTGNIFKGNISTTANGAPIVFSSNGSVSLQGATQQTISGSPIAIPNIEIKNPAGILLATPLTISGALTLTTGIINSSSIDTLILSYSATVTGGSNSSYIDGPVSKLGSNAFLFPTGNNSIFSPISMSAPGGGNDEFTAQYIHSPQSLGTALDTGITNLSSSEYWTLQRTSGSDNVSVTLPWNSSSTNVTPNDSNMRIAFFDATANIWRNDGGIDPTGNQTAGTITSANPLTSYGTLTLANRINPCQITASAGTNVTICSGTSTNLTALGGTGYSWSPSTGLNSDTIASPVANPANTTTYTVTVSNSPTCSQTATVTITVNPAPIVTASASVPAVCAGQSVILSGGGALSYTWTSGATDGNAYTPIVSNTYTVTGTDANGCSATSMVAVAVNPVPYVTANATATTICKGRPVTLTGSGARAGAVYSWTGGVADGVPFAPNSTNTYTVTFTNSSGCSGNSNVTIIVNPSPVAVAGTSATICANAAVSLTANGGTDYVWSPSTGLDNYLISAPTATPLTTTTYTVTVSNGYCRSTSTVTLTVNPSPVVSISVNPSMTINPGGNLNTIYVGYGAQSLTLTATVDANTSSYSWTSVAGLSCTSCLVATVNPTVTTTYTFTAYDGNGCATVTSVTIYVVIIGAACTFCSN